MNKSFVSLEQHICLVCNTKFDTGTILLDRKLRSKMDHHTVTNYGLCPEHLRLFNEGYVALVECDPQRSHIQAGAQQVNSCDVYRTGNIVHIKREVYAKLFDNPIKDHEAIVFIGTEAFKQLQAIAG